MEAEKTLTNEEIIRELLDLLKKNTMKEQANDVFEICTYVDGLEKKIVSMTEELTSMQDQIKKMQEDTLINNAKKLSNCLLKLHIDVRRKLFKDVIDALGGRMRFIISGGAPLDKKVAQGFNELGIEVVQGYGLTETSPVISAENA